MSIESGATIGPYTVRERIGAGGMGEVYRATDSKLGRDVAIKVLPDDVARDPERLARFRREAQLLASLNHANIAAIYGLEETAGTPLLVLELVEGEDLAARLARGPLPMEEALTLAVQISEGLEEAHEKGIVHRDLKPANIKVAPSGRLKILDFGLAKAFEASPAGRDDPSLSPTLTAAATRAGVILGTAAYMSPEQARGGSVDKRADIWAFGCVLLEMLSGSKTFAGDTISDTLASILKSDPDWTALPSGSQPSLLRLLRRCLQKDPRKRLRDIGEARLTLQELLGGGAEEDRPGTAAPVRVGRAGLTLALTAVVAAAVTAGVMLFLRPAAERQAVQKYQFTWPDNLLDESHAPVLSPDGRRILFSTPAGLWIRGLDDLDARLLAGTAGATHAAWSPDGSGIAFAREGSMQTIPANGGQVTSILTGAGIITGVGRISWGADGRIVYATGDSGISRVSSRGGDARPILEPDLAEVADIHYPSILPGGRGILFVPHKMATTYDSIRVLTDDGSRTILEFKDNEIRGPVYSPTGHLLFRRDTGNAGLWAVPFSLQTLETTGEPFLVAREGSFPSVAEDGSLLYVWNARAKRRQLVWVDRQGREIETLGPVLGEIGSPAISPDGRQVAFMAQENEMWDIWILDAGRGTRTRLTFTQAKDWDPDWTPDSKNVVFWDGASRAISMKPADGTGEVVRLVQEDFPDSGIPQVTPDGKELLFYVRQADTNFDLYMMPLEGDRKAAPFLGTPSQEDQPQMSPDGRYVAYISNESGRPEVYLTHFPDAGGRWQVSVDGGHLPIWDPRGDRLYFIEGSDMMEAEFSSQPAVRLGTPRALFSITWNDPGDWWANRYTVSPDGQRFLLVKSIKEEGEEPTVVLVRNWALEFDRTE